MANDGIELINVSARQRTNPCAEQMSVISSIYFKVS